MLLIKRVFVNSKQGRDDNNYHSLKLKPLNKRELEAVLNGNFQHAPQTHAIFANITQDPTTCHWGFVADWLKKIAVNYSKWSGRIIERRFHSLVSLPVIAGCGAKVKVATINTVCFVSWNVDLAQFAESPSRRFFCKSAANAAAEPCQSHTDTTHMKSFVFGASRCSMAVCSFAITASDCKHREHRPNRFWSPHIPHHSNRMCPVTLFSPR